MVNDYSRWWHETFGAAPDLAQTEREVAFLNRMLPLPEFHRVLDVACGFGRHARLLAERGYRVTGVERDPWVARRAEVVVKVLDMRQLHQLTESFDAVICMWQSFGYFDDEMNRDVLRQMADRLRPKGRLILDIYHRGFFESHSGEKTFERGGVVIRERSELRGNRLRVWLGGDDVFDWRTYTPAELAAESERVGLAPLLACAMWDESLPPSPEQARMQLVFERSSGGLNNPQPGNFVPKPTV